MKNLTGYWTGTISGTNSGGITLDIKQIDNRIFGIGKIHEPALGQYEYSIEGTVGNNISFNLLPGKNPHGLPLGKVHAIGVIESENKITGRWKSEIETEGVFTVERFSVKEIENELPKKNSVFIVHGHDEGAKQSVARFLERLGIEPVILQEQINKGMTVLEKFEVFADRAAFAVVLMTPDDKGYPVNGESEARLRARQNVILELGYFASKLGRDKTLVLTKGDLELPSDVFGLVYEKMDHGEGWKMRLARELKAANFEIDMNKVI
jgi:Predicted nucleotide-binding protein containing TIR -like domain